MTAPTSPALPFPVLPDASVESCIVALVAALQQSKGWMHGYADAIVRDAVDRVHLAGTCERSLTVAAVISERGLTRLAESKAHCVHAYAKIVDEDDVALVRLTDAQSALLAQAAEKDAELDRLREALQLAVDHIDMDALRISHCKDAAAIDASRALAQKEKT